MPRGDGVPFLKLVLASHLELVMEPLKVYPCVQVYRLTKARLVAGHRFRLRPRVVVSQAGLTNPPTRYHELFYVEER